MQMRLSEHILHPWFGEKTPWQRREVALNSIKQSRLDVSSYLCVKFEALARGVEERHDLIIPQPR